MTTDKGRFGIIFDMDGTLFQTEKVAVPAFHRTFQRLNEEGLYTGERPDDSQVQSVFGMTQADIWENLLPGSSDSVKEQADRWWLEDELDCLKEEMGALYPGVEETLRELDGRGWRLFVASNGLGPYIRGVIRTFSLEDLIEEGYSAGEHAIGEKDRLVGKLMKEQGIDSGYMVGDRSSDVRAGKANGLTVIGCRYAGFPQFGEGDELTGADGVIDAFPQLLEIVGSPRKYDKAIPDLR
ncbi:HAD hydrolase-like protein [Salinithrix halophila]|uniref:HAD hydrolase-like protein n=1 Tax=Salinithrix halophila TaxID=1485204 RepID=A0ABV8JA71_9BACL